MTSSWVNWTPYDGWMELNGRDCAISLEPRPSYCDRGNWIAKLHVLRNHIVLGIDNADGWPRYYFDQDRAMAECEAWMRKRGQWLETTTDELVRLRRERTEQGLCERCGERPFEMQFAADTLALTHGGIQLWCKLCVLTEQVAFAEKVAAQLPQLVADLAIERAKHLKNP